ncbi:MAG: amidophosphoribosyltransferase, partial [Lachnospiraceae bacterium]|nr:amidophosphoribosyltransferase [Lachnospiraceae bacterium]
IVIGVPDSGLDAAIGYARASGIPYGIGLIKNKYIGRTFIKPSGRMDAVKIKLAAVEETVRDKRIVLIDDSIVRGTTCAHIVRMLREAGAKEIHMRVTAPPFLHPCYYGTDVDSEDNLIACRHTVAEIAEIIGVDTLGYLPVDELPGLCGSSDICSACFDGSYPTPVPSDTRKDRFEQRLSER